jgi:hypothetical protein
MRPVYISSQPLCLPAYRPLNPDRRFGSDGQVSFSVGSAPTLNSGPLPPFPRDGYVSSIQPLPHIQMRITEPPTEQPSRPHTSLTSLMHRAWHADWKAPFIWAKNLPAKLKHNSAKAQSAQPREDTSSGRIPWVPVTETAMFNTLQGVPFRQQAFTAFDSQQLTG